MVYTDRDDDTRVTSRGVRDGSVFSSSFTRGDPERWLYRIRRSIVELLHDVEMENTMIFRGMDCWQRQPTGIPLLSVVASSVVLSG